MISFVYSIPVGNALRVLLMPPAQTRRWKLLRKDTDDISGVDDPQALLISDGRETCVTDTRGLINHVTVYYQAFYWAANTWVASNSKAGTPKIGFVESSVDPMIVVRDRLELGLAEYVSRGVLHNERGFIPVLTASPQIEEVPFPLVTVHLSSDSPDMRNVGELVAEEYRLSDSLWHTFEGGYSKTNLTIVSWALNADERIALRNAVKAVLMANLPVFDAEGMLLVSWNFMDSEDFNSYKVPMYMTNCDFTCYAYGAIETVEPPVVDVISELSPYFGTKKNG